LEAVLRTPNDLLHKNWYTQEEFIELLEGFFEKTFWDDITILYRVDEDDLSEVIRSSFDNIDEKKFVNVREH
jgi:hypothetical protein